MATQISNDVVEKLKQLILARLLSSDKSRDDSALDSALKRYFVNKLSLSSSQWQTLLRRGVDELIREGLVEPKPLRLTDQGTATAVSFVFGSETPVRVAWSTIRNRYLVAKALDVAPQTKSEWQRLASADGLRAAVLARDFELPIGSLPTLPKTLNAIAWQQLRKSLSTEPPYTVRFSRKAVLRTTLLGGRNVKDEGAALAAIATGATNSRADQIREALICAWIHALPSKSKGSSVVDLETFARKVCELACASSSGRYGDHKVFISHVWNQFRQEGIAAGMTRDDFNRYLVDANRSALLTLSRADLVGAMAAEDVRQSEIRLSTSSFHFIRTDSQAV